MFVRYYILHLFLTLFVPGPTDAWYKRYSGLSSLTNAFSTLVCQSERIENIRLEHPYVRLMIERHQSMS